MSLQESVAKREGIISEEGGRTALMTSGDADEGYETAGKKELHPRHGCCKETKKVV